MIHSGVRPPRIMGGFEFLDCSPALAMAAWERASDKQRTIILWDTPLLARKNILQTLISGAEIAKAALLDGRVFAVAWGDALFLDSKTCQIHFFYCGDDREKELLDAAALSFMEHCLARFSTLLALVPAPYLGAASLLARLGFAKSPALKKSVKVNGRLRDARFWVYNEKG